MIPATYVKADENVEVNGEAVTAVSQAGEYQQGMRGKKGGVRMWAACNGVWTVCLESLYCLLGEDLVVGEESGWI